MRRDGGGGARRARVLASIVAGTCALGAALPAAGFEQPMSAFAANVGVRDPSADGPLGVTLYVVPEGRTLLVTDILVANHGQEMGPFYLADSHKTRCSIELLEQITINNQPGGLSQLNNVHTTFSSGIPFGAGEPVVATLAGGSRGVDVTITGRLVLGPRAAAIRLPGGARDGQAERKAAEPPD